jgi:hypothetical protein
MRGTTHPLPQYAFILWCTVKSTGTTLPLPEHHDMKMYWGAQVQLHIFLTSALDGGEWSASRAGRFTPRVTSPGTRWIGGWVGPRASLDTVSKRKIPSPHRESNSDHPIVQPVASRYTDWPIPTLSENIFKVVSLSSSVHEFCTACHPLAKFHPSTSSRGNPMRPWGRWWRDTPAYTPRF